MRARRAQAALVLSLGLAAAGCGGEPEPGAAPPPPPTASTAPTMTAPAPPTTSATEEEPPRIPGIPKDLAAYRSWTRLNGKPIPPRDSDPHLGRKNVFATDEARPNGTYPRGTIIVKDAVRPGADFVGLIAVMRKQAGADPEHNDWVFVEYTRDSEDEPFSEAASGAVCWSCHAGAAEADYVWIAELELVR